MGNLRLRSYIPAKGTLAKSETDNVNSTTNA